MKTIIAALVLISTTAQAGVFCRKDSPSIIEIHMDGSGQATWKNEEPGKKPVQEVMGAGLSCQQQGVLVACFEQGVNQKASGVKPFFKTEKRTQESLIIDAGGNITTSVVNTIGIIVGPSKRNGKMLNISFRAEECSVTP